MKMDKTYIIENNILERYVLGELNVDETQQIEQLLSDDSDLLKQVNAIEENFEQLAQNNAIHPPSIVKEQLLESISKNVASTIPINKSATTKLWLNIAAGFAGLFLISSAILTFQLNKTKDQLKVVETQNETLINDIKDISEYNQTTEKWLNTIKDPDVEPYLLKGNLLSPNLKVVSYVNHKNKSVVINTSSLPDLDKDHDYQMWADVEGKMINMGVINSKDELMAMTYIDHAESLNITIEPSGGSDHPTVSNLVTQVLLK